MKKVLPKILCFLGFHDLVIFTCGGQPISGYCERCPYKFGIDL